MSQNHERESYFGLIKQSARVAVKLYFEPLEMVSRRLFPRKSNVSPSETTLPENQTSILPSDENRTST